MRQCCLFSMFAAMVLLATVVRADTLTHKTTGETFTGKVCEAKINDLTLVVKSDGTRIYLDLSEYEVIDDDKGEAEAEALLKAEEERKAQAAERARAEASEKEETKAETESAVGRDDPEEDVEPDDAGLSQTEEGEAAQPGESEEPEERKNRPKAVEIEIAEGVMMTLVHIPRGRFLMGSPPDEEGRDDDELQHRVIISRGYLMSTTEVTQAQFKAVMNYVPQHSNRGRSRLEGADKPVVSLKFEAAEMFCEKLSEEGKYKFRLPTEAEWEYAARAGKRGPFGGTGNIEEMGWVGLPGMFHLKPVAQKEPNDWGLYDMHGNVWEWCSDYYAPYEKGTQTDPETKEKDLWRWAEKLHVVRGGCHWASIDPAVSEEHGPASARCANRGQRATQRGIHYGFRVVAEPK